MVTLLQETLSMYKLMFSLETLVDFWATNRQIAVYIKKTMDEVWERLGVFFYLSTPISPDYLERRSRCWVGDVGIYFCMIHYLHISFRNGILQKRWPSDNPKIVIYCYHWTLLSILANFYHCVLCFWTSESMEGQRKFPSFLVYCLFFFRSQTARVTSFSNV